MNSPFLQRARPILRTTLNVVRQAFDKTATWVTQLSWWKFILFAVLVLSAGGIVQDTWVPHPPSTVSVRHKEKVIHVQSKAVHEGNYDVRIDDNGISIRKKNAPPVVPDSADAAVNSATNSATSAATNAAANPPPAESASALALPPAAGKSVNDAIGAAVDAVVEEAVDKALDQATEQATEQKMDDYRRKSSAWFMNFVMLLLVGLFAIKALMGGKKRAEHLASEANKNAEREALQRQVSEAKLHLMQAQVEPHFLFNTLASVEHLIETDPPRAAAMQRQLIQYLRAVLPQMRENSMQTHLGREADMVGAYLTLQKMRMEERLQFEFHIPEGLRSAAFPPMMLQSLVENAIQHGLEGKPEGGTLQVQAEVVNGQLRVKVIDDGLGFGALPSDGTGLGLRSIRDRLQLLHPGKSQLMMAPHSPSGVEATIEVPYHVASPMT